MKRNIFYFLLLLILTLSSCDSSIEVSKGNLSGTVILEGETDHSNITVALYDLAVLDPDIVSINQEYPHIGVIITQHTEFDHRLQEPVKYTETDAEGHFEIKKIPTGIYNIIAIKDSFGFKYIYEFEIEKGDNALTPNPSPRGRGDIPLFKGELKGVKSNRLSESRKLSGSQRHSTTVSGVAPYPERRLKSLYRTEADITLYPETHISGNISGSITVETNHHLVIDDDTVFIPNTSTLIIQPGAVIRINPAVDLTIHGTLTAQGEENNMFWITSNDGFSTVTLSLSKGSRFLGRNDSIQIYNSMELSSYATISDDLIEWGKWDWGNLSLSSSVSNADFSDCIFRNSESGLTISNTDNVNASNIISINCLNESYGGIVLLDCNNLNIGQSILINNYNGLYAKFCDNILIKNNYISNNYRGIWSLTVFGDIENNELTKNTECDIKLAGNTVLGEINIKYNNLRSDTGIWQYEQGSFNNFYTMKINYNNFHCAGLFILYDSSGILNDIDATNNYFDSLNTEDEIRTRIIDTLEEYSIIVLIDNWTQYLIPNAGVN